MNQKNLNNSPKQPKKKSKGKLVATISSVLALLLLAGGGYYYYSKHSKPKVVNENEIYGTIIQKYKDAINNPDNADSSINIEALKAALRKMMIILNMFSTISMVMVEKNLLFLEMINRIIHSIFIHLIKNIKL